MSRLVFRLRRSFPRALTMLVVAFLAVGALGGVHMPLEGASAAERYEWGSVPIGGGGYVTGLAIHPLEPDLVYIRTDVGGAYRWDPGRERWIPLLDVYGPSHGAYYHVDAIAVDPRDPDVVYVAVGRTVGGLSAVLRSTDRGRNWQETGIRVGIYGNADFRWAGPRLAVDPRSGAVLFGTRDRGLWRSDDGINFHQVESFPAVGIGSGDVRDGVDAVGLTFVVWDPSSGADERETTRRLYVGVFGNNQPGPEHGGIYVSDDGGATWNRIPGSPVKPVRAAIDGDGRLFASHTGGVVRCDPAGCKEIAPSHAAYSGITVVPNRPGLVMASERSRSPANAIYLSEDGGESWRRIDVPVSRRTAEPPWWPDTFFGSATSTLTLDPHYPGRVWLTDWFGVWRTEDIFADETLWRSYEQGHEEVVVHALTSPSAGTPLISGVADVGGFLHSEGFDRFPTRSERLPSDRSKGGVQDINSIAFYEADPRYVYMVGNIRSQPVGRAFRSTDYGASWQVIDPAAIPTLPDDARGGRIAVSSVDPDRILWLPMGKIPYFSGDGGRTWRPAEGVADADIVPDVWNPSVYLASNTTGAEVFYIFKPGTGLLRSRDGGGGGNGDGDGDGDGDEDEDDLRFEAITNSGLPRTSARFTFIHAAPGIEGEVWVSMDREGLYRSVDFGETFEKVGGVQQALLFGFGKGKPGTGLPAAYIYGRANGDAAEGVYRSDDAGESWVRISSPDVLFGSGPKVLAGDRQVYGRVYVGTSGRGIYVGERSPAYAQIGVGGAEVRIGTHETDYEVELPFGVDRMPSVEARLLWDELDRVVVRSVERATAQSAVSLEALLREAASEAAARGVDRIAARVEAGAISSEHAAGAISSELAAGAGKASPAEAGGPGVVSGGAMGAGRESAAGSDAAAGGKLPQVQGAQLRVTHGTQVPGTIVVELLDAGGALLHRAHAHVYAADRPEVRVEIGGRRLPLDSRETLTLWGEVPLRVEVDGPSDMIGQVNVALIPVRGGAPVAAERALLFAGVMPGVIAFDTQSYDDGAYDLSILVETITGTSVRLEQRFLLDNWNVVEDELLPPQQSGWFGLVKQRHTVEESDGWEDAVGDAAEFFGDGNRLAARSGAQNPYLIWEADRLERIDLTVYVSPEDGADLMAGNSAALSIAVSGNGNEWIPIPYDVELEASSASRLKLRLHGNAPAGLDVKQIRVLLATNQAPRSLQLGRLVLTLRAH